MANNISKKTSIIVPCYNVEKYISECIDSLVSQTVGIENLELIFVDDCSTDRTVSIIKSYEAKYPENVLLILSAQNGRQGTARNIGLSYASGKYIMFVDSDDIISPFAVERLNSIAETYHTDIVQFRYSYDLDEVCNHATKEISFYNYSSPASFKQHLLDSSILNEFCTTKYYNRESIIQSGVCFAEGVCYEEPLFTYPLKFFVNRVCVIEEPLYFYRINENGTMLSTMNNDTSILDHLKVQLILYSKMTNSTYYQTNKSEIDFYFIHCFLFEPLSFYAMRGKVLPPNIFSFMVDKISAILPDYQSNDYLGISETMGETSVVRLSQKKFDNDDALLRQIILLETRLANKWEKPVLNQIEVQLAQHCNLNCKGCSHFSNLVTTPVFYDFETYKKDVERLSELFSQVSKFYFLGGEPLLNPNITDYISYTRKILPQSELILVTNGVLLLSMSDSVISCIKNNNVFISISDYLCLDNEKIVSFICEKELAAELRIERDLFTSYLNPIGDSNPIEVFDKCPRKYCTIMDHGRLSPCCQPIMVQYLNERFDCLFPTTDYIRLSNPEIDGYDILDYISHPIESCKYCSYDEKFEWEISKEPKLTDWCVSRKQV